MRGMDDRVASAQDRAPLLRDAGSRADVETIGQLGAQIAHDFNNVLAVVLTSVEMAMRVGDPAKANGFLANAIKTINRGRGMTDRLAAAARECGEAGRVDVHALIAAIERELASSADRFAGLDVAVRADAPRSVVRGDRLFLDRALRHVVSNAIEAMPRGGRLTIATSVARGPELRGDGAEEYLAVSIADTGEGLSPDVRVRAFELFFGTRGEGAQRGIGLAQAKDAVRRAGGYVTIDGEEGRGAAVTLMIPLDRSGES